MCFRPRSGGAVRWGMAQEQRELETDVLIVGSGPAGATYARILASLGKDVIMVDSGAQLRARPGRHLLNDFRYQKQPNLSLALLMSYADYYSIVEEPSNKAALEVPAKPDALAMYEPLLTRLNFSNPYQNPNRNMTGAGIMSAVGGMFSLWSGFAPDPAEHERTDLLSLEEWKLILGVARKLFKVNREAFSDSMVSNAMLELIAATGRCDFGYAPVAARKLDIQNELFHFVDWTGVDTILGPLLDDRNCCVDGFQILQEHRAEKLVRNKSGDRIDYAEVRNLANYNEVVCIRAENYVVGGGPFLTPRLLWMSGIRPDALARYLGDNIVATGYVRLNNAMIEKLVANKNNPASEEAVPIAWNDPEPRLEFPPTVQRPWMGHISRTARYTTYSENFDVRLITDLTWYGPVELSRENRVLFSDTMTDRFGMPQISVDFRYSERDLKVSKDMLADITEVADMIGVWVPHPPLYPEGAGLEAPGTSQHTMSTCRMGKNEKTSVVDTSCRVWGIDNLYLAGQHVIPNPIASNPTLTGSAFSVLGAAHLLGSDLAKVAQAIGVEDPAPEPCPTNGDESA